jgi:hypothetical protein
MTTGNFADWNGNMFDLGPIYPFVGWEVPMVILLVILWVGWHILQIRMEERQLDHESAMLKQGDNLQKALEDENVIQRM